MIDHNKDIPLAPDQDLNQEVETVAEIIIRTNKMMLISEFMYRTNIWNNVYKMM